MKFYKYQGTGNDFVMIDDREKIFPRGNHQLVSELCDRRFGIGADGLILLQQNGNQSLEMIYYNSDGFEGSMCGNGGRCFVKFAHDLGLFKTHLEFKASDGLHEAFIEHEKVHLKMIDVNEIDTMSEGVFMNTGSPHLVKFVDNLEQYQVYSEGKSIRYSANFAPKGTNVNFAQIEEDRLYVRTYERGVEDETYSCGTGVTAAAIASRQIGINSPVKIKTKGGNLEVKYVEINPNTFTNIYLIGPAEKVFEGTV